jgi:molecular chaperone DnaK (HSP70)
VIRGLSPLLQPRHGLDRRESLALVLRYLLSTVDEGRWRPETATVVFVVEPALPFEERLAVTEAMQLANATLAAIIDSPTAAATTYALEKRSLYADAAKTVVFVDVGATHSWASVCRFVRRGNAAEVEQLSVATNYSLGGTLIDRRLADYLITKFERAHNVRVESERAKIQFLNEAIRAKELLTMNDAVEVRLEDVVGDNGLQCRLTKAEFEGLVGDFGVSLASLYREVVERSGLQLSEIDSVELLGGVTRVPLVKNVLIETSGLEKLNRTMNSDEAIALGAGYVGALKSSSFIVKSVPIRPFVGIDVFLTSKKSSRMLFSELSRTNEIVSVPVDVGDLDIYAIEAGPNRTKLAKFFVEFPPDGSENDEVVLSFGFNQFLVPTILNATIDGKALEVHVEKPEWMLDEKQFAESQKFIRKMDAILRNRHKLQQIRSDFESYLYKVKSRLENDETFIKVLSESEKSAITTQLAKNLKWFESAENPKGKEITKTLTELKAITRQPEIRAEQIVKREPALKRLNQTLGTVLNSLNVTWPMFRKWIPEEKMEKLWTLYNSTATWYHDNAGLIKKAQVWDDPVVMDYEIDRKCTELERLYNQTNAIKKPTPTRTPKVPKANHTR